MGYKPLTICCMLQEEGLRADHMRIHNFLLLLLFTPCPLSAYVGQDPKNNADAQRQFELGVRQLAMLPVIHSLLTIGHPNQVSAYHVNPSQRSYPWPPSLPFWSAHEELLLGAMVRHPLHMAQPLQSLLLQLLFHRHNPCLLQHIYISLPVLQGEPMQGCPAGTALEMS